MVLGYSAMSLRTTEYITQRFNSKEYLGEIMDTISNEVYFTHPYSSAERLRPKYVQGIIFRIQRDQNQTGKCYSTYQKRFRSSYRSWEKP